MSLRLADYRDFFEAARERAVEALPGAVLSPAGSLARGELIPGLSDLDILVVAPDGRGPETRDAIPALAEELGPLLTLFIDPFSAIGTLCSVYAGPLKVDWLVCEGEPPDRTWIWSGRQPPPYDADAHPWDWIWWLWGKIRRGECELGRSELAKLWQWLVRNGVSPTAFPPGLPPAEQAQLEALVLETLRQLPSRHERLAAEIAGAIRDDAQRGTAG